MRAASQSSNCFLENEAYLEIDTAGVDGFVKVIFLR